MKSHDIVKLLEQLASEDPTQSAKVAGKVVQGIGILVHKVRKKADFVQGLGKMASGIVHISKGVLEIREAFQLSFKAGEEAGEEFGTQYPDPESIPDELLE